MTRLTGSDLNMNHAAPQGAAQESQDDPMLQFTSDYLAAIHDTISGLLDRLDVGAVLEGILQKATQLLNTPHGFIYLLDEEGLELEPRHALGVFRGRLILRFKAGEGLSGRVLQSGQPLAVEQYHAWEGRTWKTAEFPVQAMVGIPLKSHGQTFGVLGLARTEPGLFFTPREIEVLERFARLASAALQNARLFDAAQRELAERRQVEARLQRQGRLLQAVAEAANAWLVEPDTYQAAEQALKLLGQAMEVDRVFIFENSTDPHSGALLLNQRFEWVRSPAGLQVNSPELQQQPYDPALTRWRTLLSSGQVVSGLARELPASERTILSRAAILAVLIVPILVDGSFWGYMGYGDCRRERIWREDEKSILAAAAVSLGAVLVRRRAELALQQSTARFQAFMDNLPLLAFIKDDQGHYIFINHKVEQLFDTCLARLDGKTDAHLFPPEVAQQAAAEDRSVLQNGLPTDSEYTLAALDGATYTWRVFRFPVDLPGHRRLVGGVASDITERKLAQEQLRRWVTELEQRNREVGMLSNLNNFLQLCDTPQEVYVVVREYGEQLFPAANGLLMMQVPGDTKRLERAAAWGKDALDDATRMPVECLAHVHECPVMLSGAGSGQTPYCELFPRRAASYRLSLPIMTQNAPQANPQPAGVLCLWSEQPGDFLYENQKQLANVFVERIGLTLTSLNMREVLRQQAIRDPLTGLFNRRYLYDTLEREVRRAGRYETAISMIMIDIDHFKRVNDTYGHATGDAVLRAVGGVLGSSVRDSDLASRYGGEEFLLVLIETSLQDAVLRADEIRQKIAHLQVAYLDKIVDNITVSAGVAAFPRHGDTMDEVISAADAALYRAKQAGRNRVVQCEERREKKEE